MRDDPIAQVLDDLMRLDDIYACIVARRNMISVMPTDEQFKPEVNQIWDVIKRAMDDVFTVIGEYSGAGLTEIEFRLQNYEVLFYVFPEMENALVAIVPALANKGLLEVELENARRDIFKIMNTPSQTTDTTQKDELYATA
ncbi:MAG: hypothetical protein MUC80_09150 [Candidatus Thermoplasmatota archaeon]|jgi:hypothetical protein|nr:hypothetical protein [Candidatus Thermoplasmatota archaeon]